MNRRSSKKNSTSNWPRSRGPNVLVELGYDEIMRTGLRQYRHSTEPSGVQRNARSLSYDRAVREAGRIYHKNCFGIMNKQRFPLHSILSAAKYATAYGIGQPGSVMILPHGMPEMLDYTRPEKMEFKISGLKTTDGKPITMDLGTSHTDSATNIKMLVHIPQPTFGTARRTRRSARATRQCGRRAPVHCHSGIDDQRNGHCRPYPRYCSQLQ